MRGIGQPADDIRRLGPDIDEIFTPSFKCLVSTSFVLLSRRATTSLCIGLHDEGKWEPFAGFTAYPTIAGIWWAARPSREKRAGMHAALVLGLLNAYKHERRRLESRTVQSDSELDDFQNAIRGAARPVLDSGWAAKLAFTDRLLAPTEAASWLKENRPWGRWSW